MQINNSRGGVIEWIKWGTDEQCYKSHRSSLRILDQKIWKER